MAKLFSTKRDSKRYAEVVHREDSGPYALTPSFENVQQVFGISTRAEDRTYHARFSREEAVKLRDFLNKHVR